jgi:hypothetical protein
MIIKFIVKISGYLKLDDNVEVIPKQSQVNRIHFSMKDLQTLLIAIEFPDNLDRRTALEIAQNEINKIEEFFTYLFGIVFANHYINRIEYKDYVEGYERFDTRQILYKELNKNDLDKIKELLTETTVIFKNSNKLYIDMYKNALVIEDESARFMFLYGILILIYKVQAKVDKHIRKCPGYKKEEDRKSTKNIEVDETIYTWLRNQVGHTQKNSNIKKIRLEMKQHVGELQDIVKRAIF